MTGSGIKSIAHFLATASLSAVFWFGSTTFEFSASSTILRNDPKLGRCINVAGALEAPNEGDWGYRIRDEDLAKIADAGFSLIRLPVKWSGHAEDNAPYTIDPTFLARVDHVINTANANGLTVVLDMHHYDELYAEPEKHIDRFTNIWVQLARHYASYPDDKLIFELINEPRDNFSGAVMSNTQNRLLSMVRQSNPSRTVILTGDVWGQFKGLKHLYVPQDPNIMVSVHSYDPYKFTHQGAAWLDNPPPEGAVWGNDKDVRDLAEFAEALAKWSDKHQTPIFFGEFGVSENVNIYQRANWTAGVRGALDSVGIPWCYYDFASSFSAFDQRRGAWSPLLLTALIPETTRKKVGS